jgi:hypothetical protein
MTFGVRDFSGETAIDDIYEHERYSYLSFSWGSSFPGHLLPTDRRRWSGLHGAPSAQTRAKIEPQLPVGWRWTSDWEVDLESANGDNDGWVYAFDFTNFNIMSARNGVRKAPRATDYVRRRRWTRRRERVPEVSIPSTATTAVSEEESDPAVEENEEATEAKSNNVELDDLHIPDSLDVDDEEGEDAGDDDDEDEKADEDDNGAGVFRRGQSFQCDTTVPPKTPPPRKASSGVQAPASLRSFSMDMEKSAIDSAWTKAVKQLETMYAQANSHKTVKKKRWTVKKEMIQQQIHLLEKTIAAMQSFLQENHMPRRHSSSYLHPSKSFPGKTPLSPDGSTTASSRVSPSDTHGINLANKLKCAQSKLDALKRLYWHPREKDYTLRFSIDGIFYGLRDFFIEQFQGSFSLRMSHQSNGAQGITPTCKIVMAGHTVCCGKHVKVVGDKGTIVPKTIWDMMYLDTDFELTAYLIYVDHVEKERNEWLADKPTGSWEFLLTPDATRVELTNFNRRTRGGLDLPEPVVRKLMSDVLSTLVRDLVLVYFPQELAMAFDAPPAKLDMDGEISLTGPSIDHVVEREIELTSGEAIIKPSPSPASSAGVSSTSSPSNGGVNGVLSSAKSQPLSPTLAAVAAAASATVNLLIGNDTVECMRRIAELLELTPAQLNLLVAVRQCSLYPSPYSFRSVASICDYFRAFFGDKEHELDGGADHIKQLRAVWTQLLELVYIRKAKAMAAGKPSHKYELFDMDMFLDRIAQLTRKPAKVELSLKRFNCTVNAMSVVDAMAQMFERVVLGIDYSKPRVENDRLIYGFRFGRKPKVSSAAALAAHAQSSQLLDPAVQLQVDGSFRSRLKAFSKFCRAMKGGIELVKRNLDRLSVEVVGYAHGTGNDCAIHGSFRDFDFSGPVSLSLHVPALFLGMYRVQTVDLGNDRVGLQVELLLPMPAASPVRTKQRKPRKDERVLLKAMLTDFSMDVLLDMDALIAKHHSRSVTAANERVAPWSPTAAYAMQVEAEKTNEKHPALSISVQSTTGSSYETDEHVIRIPSPRNNPHEPYGKIRVASSEFTKLHVKAKSGSFATNVAPLLKWLLHAVRPFYLESFPEHQVLFDRLHSCLMTWLCSQELRVDFDFLIKSFLHPKAGDPSNELLFFTVCGSPTNATPIVYKDEVNLLDMILQGDDLVNIWIDDRYPPYANPLYF